MLTRITIENFKKLDCSIDLSTNVVFVGPNNSGKTSALQAIYLWNFGLKKWIEMRKSKKSIAKKRTGVPINRKDLYYIPIPSLRQIWRNLQVRELKRSNGKQQTKNITIKIVVEGFTNGKNWKIGLEFDFSNSEVCYVRLLGEEIKDEDLELGAKEKVIYLPPMSGLTADEYKLELGAINVMVGQGKTADVLRNLCLYVYENRYTNGNDRWKSIVDLIESVFGIKLNDPVYDATTSKITLTYREKNNEYDLINGGRGFHQFLLLLSYIYASQDKNYSTVIMIDEPDSHLEILRQKQIYNYLCDIINKENSQLIIATHSEVILNEAKSKYPIIAFLGKPHVVNQPHQLAKSLSLISFDKYLLAEQKGWVLYLEGSTDLDMLRGFAKKLEHPVEKYLQNPFVEYVGNKPQNARNNFYALLEGVPDLVGVALYDKLEEEICHEREKLLEMMWNRNEIENYLPLPDVLIRYLEKRKTDLFTYDLIDFVYKILQEEFPPAALKDKGHDFWKDTKISDKFLDFIFKRISKEKGIPILLNKSRYYELIEYADIDEIAEEIEEKLNAICDIARNYERNLN